MADDGMRAAICRRYGGPEVVEVQRRPIPVPGKGEALIRVRTSSVSSGDARIRAMRMPAGMGGFGRLAFGMTGPRHPVLGSELCGDVVALGPEVTGVAEGQRILGATGFRMGGHAEFCCLPAITVFPAPDILTDDEAGAMIFGGTPALVYLRDKARLRAGERLLVLGAAGAVGSAAVQIARAMGAEVWAQARSSRHDALRALGADHLFDRHNRDFADLSQTWDVILDTVGNYPVNRLRRVLAPDGRLLLLAAGLGQMLLLPPGNRLRPQKVLAGPVMDRPDDVRALARMAEAGQFRPVIDSAFPLTAIVEAHRRVDMGEKFGSVVVRLRDQARSDAAWAFSTRSASAGAMPKSTPR